MDARTIIVGIILLTVAIVVVIRHLKNGTSDAQDFTKDVVHARENGKDPDEVGEDVNSCRWV